MEIPADTDTGILDDLGFEVEEAIINFLDQLETSSGRVCDIHDDATRASLAEHITLHLRERFLQKVIQ